MILTNLTELYINAKWKYYENDSIILLLLSHDVTVINY